MYRNTVPLTTGALHKSSSGLMPLSVLMWPHACTLRTGLIIEDIEVLSVYLVKGSLSELTATGNRGPANRTACCNYIKQAR